MSTPAAVAEARLALGRRLAGLRQNAGLTQAVAGVRMGYRRSAVARAEATGVCSHDFAACPTGCMVPATSSRSPTTGSRR